MNTLNRICADKKEHVRVMQAQTPLAALQERITEQTPPRGFKARLLDFAGQNRPALIAEVKKASPSKGVIREDFDPLAIARSYAAAGAACLSVLTDEPYFQGRDEYLVQIRAQTDLPLLRKDFMIDPYQIYESRALGADCVLLIMAALSDSHAAGLHELSLSLGMDVLVEVHDEVELSRALQFKPAIIGVNNRNLKTLAVDIGTAYDFVAKIPGEIIKIAESGIETCEDLSGLKDAGYQGFLVGESLMRQNDIEAAVKKLLGSA